MEKKTISVSEDVSKLLIHETDRDYSSILDGIFFGMKKTVLNCLIDVICKMKKDGRLNSIADSQIHISEELYFFLKKIRAIKNLTPNNVIEPIIFGLGYKNFQKVVSRIPNRE